MPKISRTAYWTFSRQFDAGEYPHQRFGQAFFNIMVVEEVNADPDLFYTEDRKVAEQLIEEKYLEPLE